jgi:hypothetical protein
MAGERILLNGRFPDFAAIDLHIDGDVIDSGFTELNYSHGLEPGIAKGAQPAALGDTTGEYTAEGSITMHRRTWVKILEKFGNGYMKKRFVIVVNYDDEDGEGMCTDTLTGCRFKKSENGHSQGTDPLMVKLDLHILRVKEHGKHPFNTNG